MKSLIICSTQRSGSTLFCKDINQTNKLGVGGEWFYRKGWTKSLEEEGQDTLIKKLDNLKETCTTPNGMSTIKVMANYYQKVIKNLNRIDKYRTLPFDSTIQAVFENPSFVRVYRRNKIRQAISLLISQQTGKYHSFQDKEVIKPKKEVVITNDKIDNMVNTLQNWENKWDVFFHKLKIAPMLIVYENYIQDPEYYIKKLGESVGVEMNDLELSNRISRVATTANEQYYHDYLLYLEDRFRGYKKIL